MDDLARLGLEVDSGPVQRANTALDEFSRAGRRAEKSATDLLNEERKLRHENDNLAGSVRITARSIAAIDGPLGGIASRFSSLAAVIREIGPLFAATAIGISGSIFAIKGGLTAFADFQQGLTNVGAVAGATAEQIAELDKAALRAAASTRFNPEQTTEALYALASSGQNAAQQIATLPNVLNLAEAAQADLGTTTELVTSTLNVFHIAASESTRVVDTFVASIGASALNVNRLQVALRNAGPTAAALGQSFEQTTAGLALLTTAFGNGERAGTGLRAIFAELPQKASDLGIKIHDANGQFLPFLDILKQIEARGITSTQIVGTFGAEAGPALAALLGNGSKALSEMEARIRSNGQAAATAGQQLDTLKGDFDNLASAIDVALVEIGRSQASAARIGVQAVTNLIRLWSGYGDTLGEAEASTIALSDAIQTLAAVGATSLIGRFLTPYLATSAAAIASTVRMATTMGAAAVAARGLAGGLALLRGGLALLGGPVGVALLAGYAIYELVGNQDAAAQAADTHRQALDQLAGKIAEAGEQSAAYQRTLQGQIALELEAAKAALASAEAEQAKHQNYAFGGVFDDLIGKGPKHEQEAIDALRASITGLEGNLLQLGKSAATAELRQKLEEMAQGAKKGAAGFTILTDAQKRAQQTVKDLIADLEYEISLHGKTASEIAVSNNLRKAGAAATDDQRKHIRGLTLDLEQLSATQEAVDFLSSSLYDAFRGWAMGTTSLTDTFKNLGLAIAEAALKAQLLGTGPLASLFGSSAGSGTGGLIGSLISGVFGGGSAVGAPLNILPGAAGGGRIVGAGSATSDSIVARVSNGEFIVNAASASRNMALLEAINDNRAGAGPGFADGGRVEIGPSAAPSTGLRVTIINQGNIESRVGQSADGSLEVINKIVEKRVTEALDQQVPERVAAALRAPRRR